jgi:MFS family permease
MASSVFHCAGAALAAGSVHYAMFAIARFIGGIGASMSLTLPPVFVSEIAPPHSRGRLVSFHVVSFNSGYLVSSLGSLGFSYVDKDFQWRLNFIVNTAISVLSILLIYIVPESPRWLVSKDRIDEAADVLRRLHTNKYDQDGIVAQAELVQIQQQLEESKHLPRGFRYIFTDRAHRKRILFTIMIWFMAMSTGVLVIAVYSTVLFASLGYNNAGAQFGLSAAWLVCCIICAALGGLVVDRIGRVRMIGMLPCSDIRLHFLFANLGDDDRSRGWISLRSLSCCRNRYAGQISRHS